MRKSFILFGVIGMAISTAALAGCGGGGAKKDQYVDGDKIKVEIHNLYFGSYEGGDTYLEKIADKFGLSFSLGTYDYPNWDTQVTSDILGKKRPDVFHANIDAYNYATSYKYWAEEFVTKPLPDDLSKWPNLKEMIENTSNIDALKIDGKLYGIPIAKNTSDYSTSFSPFTYIYRRDWAKDWGVYQENDEYTWEQFKNLLNVFKTNLASKQRSYALGDVEWGYPSITNFYKQVPHCFAQDENGQYVNNYTTDEYIAGLKETKRFYNDKKGYYHPDNIALSDGMMNDYYTQNQVGVFYENLSYENFNTIRLNLKENNSSRPNFNVEDATAIMKIRGEDGKYALEGTDNWFSMTFFDYRISDEKFERLLNLIEWLLSEEGTIFAVYGIEGLDYEMVNGKPQIIEENWSIVNGERVANKNGAKYLRYLATLGYDTLEYNPVTNKNVVKYLNDWDTEMKEAYAKGELKILKENPKVMWLTTPLKSENSGAMRTNALKVVKKYSLNSDTENFVNDYKDEFGGIWTSVLEEINDAIGGK